MITFMYFCLSLLLLLVATAADLTSMATNQYRTNMIITLISSVGSVIFAGLSLRKARHGLFTRGLAALIVVIAFFLILDAVRRF